MPDLLTLGARRRTLFGSTLDQKILFRVILGRVAAFHNCPEGINSAVGPGATLALIAFDLQSDGGDRQAWRCWKPGASVARSGVAGSVLIRHQVPSETSAALGRATWLH